VGFGVEDILFGLVSGKFLGNEFEVFRSLDALRSSDVDFDEVLKVSELEPIT
jgi:hypothetical protein